MNAGTAPVSRGVSTAPAPPDPGGCPVLSDSQGPRHLTGPDRGDAFYFSVRHACTHAHTHTRTHTQKYKHNNREVHR